MSKERKKQYIHMMIAIVGVILLTVVDQWTKRIAFHNLKGKPDLSLIPGWFSLHYLENRGAAFGIFQDKQIFFYIITAIVLLFLFLIYWKFPNQKRYLPLRITFIFLMAGAIGNFIDRIVYHYVVDFFYLEIIDFPVFNVADIYVTVSVTALILLILFYYKDDELTFFKKKKLDKTNSDQEQE